ncbi:MAG: PAS domain S-box protein [Nitrospinae bacterium]|nr:PAS domain S-box protein [Nitrospinota bacterium]
MPGRINLLLVEDSEDDALLVSRALTRGGMEVEPTRVCTREAMESCLREKQIDIILSDHKMPDFDSYGALDTLKKSGLDIPFIIVSGTIGEDKAVEAMKAGASDYILKDKLDRLAPAVERELKEADGRRLRREAEKEKEESEKRFRMLVNAAPDAVILVDGDGCVIFWSGVAEAMFGHPAAQASGRKIHELILPAGRPPACLEMLDNLRQSSSNVPKTDTFEITAARMDGKEFPAEISMSAEQLGGQLHFIVIVRDISERKRTERMLLQSEKMASIGQMAAGLVHEINSPLTFVYSNYAYVREKMLLVFKTLESVTGASKQPLGKPSPNAMDSLEAIVGMKDELNSAIDESIEGARRIMGIVKDLKNFSHASEDRWEPVDVNSALDSALNIARSEVKYKARVVKEYGDLPMIDAIGGQLGQVFLNLIINAAQAIKSHGSIKLKTRVQDGGILAQISDTGEGIPEEYLDRIFDPFFTTKPTGQGTGLGLSISYGIIQKHKGRITVDSGPGEGTTFSIWLPESPRGQ